MQLDEITIKKVLPTELDFLVKIARETFIAAFGGLNSKEDMALYLSHSMSRDHIKRELMNADSHFYFARSDRQVAGYLKYNVGAAQNEPLGDSALELERIYVQSAFQGKGLGSRLVDFTLEEARRMDKRMIWLGVWERNDGARRLYESYGFVAFDSHDFWLGNDRQTDVLMKLDL